MTTTVRTIRNGVPFVLALALATACAGKSPTNVTETKVNVPDLAADRTAIGQQSDAMGLATPDSYVKKTQFEVLDAQGKPVANAKVTVAGQILQTDERGLITSLYDVEAQHLARQRRIRHALDHLLPVGLALGAIVDLPVIAVVHPDRDRGSRRNLNRYLEIFLVDGVRHLRIVVERVAMLWRRHIDAPLRIVRRLSLPADVGIGMYRIRRGSAVHRGRFKQAAHPQRYVIGCPRLAAKDERFLMVARVQAGIGLGDIFADAFVMQEDTLEPLSGRARIVRRPHGATAQHQSERP